ncbi:hypothetical protein [Colwellia sp. E2M01]|uniref:hypothetical protein n=1 Tax=Colwellia sp. E2M01 TaxID=2841561 RepID=UPI001C0A066B|nr:hypothetical protein [Colwellia sp. E2M01]MBU2869765.1 hypothetical protein [Colwellia sp. E2M01]
MSINFTHFDESSAKILTLLAQNFPKPTEVGFQNLYPDDEGDENKRAIHIGTLAFLRHDDFIAHEVGSAASFILTAKGLELFNENISEHIQMRLNY